MADPWPWPASATFDEEGLSIGDVGARELADRFDTPLIVYDVEEVRERMRALRGAFPRVSYAVKAFTGHAMLRLAVEEDLDLLCASGGEMQACLRAGISAARITSSTGTRRPRPSCARPSRSRHRASDRRRCRGAPAAGRARAGGRPDRRRRVAGTLPVCGRRRTRRSRRGTRSRSSGSGGGRPRPRSRPRPGSKVCACRDCRRTSAARILEPEPVVAALEAMVDVAREASFAPAIIDVGGGFGRVQLHATEPGPRYRSRWRGPSPRAWRASRARVRASPVPGSRAGSVAYVAPNPPPTWIASAPRHVHRLGGARRARAQREFSRSQRGKLCSP